MPNYRRNYVPGGTYFFTLVAYERRRLFDLSACRQMLRASIQKQQELRPFQMVACVLLSDHLHCIWTLPPDDSDYSTRWGLIKEDFSRQFIAAGGDDGLRTLSRKRHRERAVWQRRFWEHTVRDEDDLQRCVDYIHWNPAKHGAAQQVKDWPWSTFHRFVEAGEYSADWGRIDRCPGYETPEWYSSCPPLTVGLRKRQSVRRSSRKN